MEPEGDGVGVLSVLAFGILVVDVGELSLAVPLAVADVDEDADVNFLDLGGALRRTSFINAVSRGFTFARSSAVVRTGSS